MWEMVAAIKPTDFQCAIQNFILEFKQQALSNKTVEIIQEQCAEDTVTVAVMAVQYTVGYASHSCVDQDSMASRHEG
jgi:hypothetical protein